MGRSTQRATERGGAGRESSWAGLESFRPTLFKFLMKRCRDANEADDLIQETLLRAARYRRHLANRARMRSWIVQIAANVFRDHVRRSQRRPSYGVADEVFEKVEGSEPVPGGAGDETPVDLGSEVVDKDVALGYLRRAFGALVDRDRRVLASYYGGAESTAVTAAECGITPGLVKVRLFRARRRLYRAVRALAIEDRDRRLVRFVP